MLLGKLIEEAPKSNITRIEVIPKSFEEFDDIPEMDMLKLLKFVGHLAWVNLKKEIIGLRCSLVYQKTLQAVVLGCTFK